MEFRLLGPLEVIDANGAVVEVRGVKLRALLGALLLDAGRPVSSDRLSEILWGDEPPAGSANALQARISKLRKLLSRGADNVLDKRETGYVLMVDPQSIDIERFTELARRGRRLLDDGDTTSAAAILRDALAIWRGPALADFAFDAFADAERIRLEEMQMAAAEDRIEADIANGRHDHVIPELEALVTVAPLRERLWGHLMLALYRSGRQSDALRAFQRARTHLADELGIDPGPQLRHLEAQILDHAPEVDVRERPARPRRSNVRPELSDLFGRVSELDELVGLVARQRLISLVGPGGVGKTRLANEVALRVAPSFDDGAWLVELASSDDERGVVEAFVRTFGPAIIPSVDGDLLDDLVDALADQRMLIVVDNCEHVLGAATRVVTAILRGSRGVRVVATSREPLGAAGETVRVVDPLPLADAAAMFLGRAASVTGGSEDAVRAVDEVEAVCRRLDCLPLSIELAAARLHVYSVSQLAELLNERLKVLGSTSGDRPSRQRTLQATVEWSYRLLFTDEQRLLDRLSVFRGGFTIDAVTAVCSDDHLPADEISLLLAHLVEKSLVVRGRGGRYHLLVAVAEYAAARLDERGEVDAMRTAQVRWIVSSTAGLTAGLRGATPLPWARSMQGEEMNLLQTATWALAGGDLTAALQIGCQVAWYSFLSANLNHDVPLLLRLIRRSADVAPTVRCRALMWAGLLTVGRNGLRSPNLDSVDTARSMVTFTSADTKIDLSDGGVGLSIESVDVARTTADVALLIESTSIAAFRLAASGTVPDLARQLADECRALAGGIGDRWSDAFVRFTDGVLALGRGDIETSKGLLTDARAAFSDLGDAGTAALTDASLGEVSFVRGDISAAREHFGRAAGFGAAAGFRSSLVLRSRLVWLTCCDLDVDAALDLGQALMLDSSSLFNPIIHAHSAFALGCAESIAGLDAEADDHLSTALTIYERFGVRREGALCQTELGYVTSRQGAALDASRHHGGALRTAIGLRSPLDVVPAAIGFAASHVEHDPATAVAVLRFVDGELARLGHRLSARDRSRYDRTAVALGRGAIEQNDDQRLSRSDLLALTS